MASETEIANLALSHIGVGKVIQNLENDKTAEARAIRRIFKVTRDQVLRAFPWPFATKRAELALIEENPNVHFAFSYAYPTDCIWARNIENDIRNENRQTRITYKVESGASGKIILTDRDEAILVYTFREVQTVRYPDDFTNALALRLGWTSAPELTKGDPFKIRRGTAMLYNDQLKMAMQAAADEEQRDELPEAEFIRTREGQADRGRGEDFNQLFNVNP